MTNAMPGRWTPYSCRISKEAGEIFDKVLQGLTGVKYEALSVATQVVAGTNYSFFCNAQIVYPKAPYYPVLIEVYAPLPGQGDPHITQIKNLQQ